MICLTAMFSAIPCLLADDPANVSSEAQRLRGILNRIINHDLSLDPIVTPLLATLARENNDQGIGALHGALGETGPLRQGVQAGRKALRIRHRNGMKVRKKRPGGSIGGPGVQVSPLNPLSVR
jgi:hypothetical protein